MTLPTRTERQRTRRKKLRAEGYRRLDVYVDPQLFERLRPYLRPYGGDTHPGYALVQLLDEWTPE